MVSGPIKGKKFIWIYCPDTHYLKIHSHFILVAYLTYYPNQVIIYSSTRITQVDCNKLHPHPLFPPKGLIHFNPIKRINQSPSYIHLPRMMNQISKNLINIIAMKRSLSVIFLQGVFIKFRINDDFFRLVLMR
jgi:hypothetical protein